MGKLRRSRIGIAALAAVLIASSAFAVLELMDREQPGPLALASARGGASRFAALTFGAPADDVLAAAAIKTSPYRFYAPNETPSVVTEYRTPNGWLLRPTGTQLDVSRAPTGVTVSPDRQTVFVVNSGPFQEALNAFDAETFAETASPTSDLFMGIAADNANNVWTSGGSRNRIFQYKYEGPVAGGLRQIGPAPGQPDAGIAVAGYPGNMVLAGAESDGGADAPAKILYVAGNLSIPNDAIKAFDPAADECDRSRICSVISVIDVSDSENFEPPVHLVPVGRDAYGIALHEGADRLYVSNWADETNPERGDGKGTISVVDISTPGEEKEIEVISVGRHPTGLALSRDLTRLAVANSADDSVTVFTVEPDGALTHKRTRSVKTDPKAPRGATPLAVEFGPRSDVLFVALAGQNALLYLDRNGKAIPRRLEVGTAQNATKITSPHTYIPTGWYPSALDIGIHPSTKTRRLYVTNLKGIGSGAGYNAGAVGPVEGTRTMGTLSAIDLDFEGAQSLDRLTATVIENNNWISLFDRKLKDAARDPCAEAPLPNGDKTKSNLLCKASKSKLGQQLHVLYIVKENKTFDQYFGDIKPTLPDADADPTFLLYGEDVTTNQHNLAREFVLMDNFWADSEASTTGHSWTSAGYATEYVEITWHFEYDEGLRGNRGAGQYEGQFDGERDEEIAEQERELFEPEERLVDLLADDSTNPLGATFRIYSDDVNDDSPAKSEQVPLELWGIGSSAVHHGRDLDFPDTDRANMFIHGKTISHAWGACGFPPSQENCGKPPPETYGQEIAFEPADREKFTLDAWVENYDECIEAGKSDKVCQREMPNFIYMALPVDHTLGFNPEMPTPESMVADNDEAVGMIVDALSKSPFWKRTLVMITEDDTQAAGDHVDSHRTFLLTAGGLSRTLGAEGLASHQAGSFPSILKTVEVLLQLPALTIYDRAAVPLHDIIVNSLAEANEVEYTSEDPPQPFVLNRKGTLLGRISQQLDWTLDLADPYVLRDLLYRGIRGWPLPPSTRRLGTRAKG